MKVEFTTEGDFNNSTKLLQKLIRSDSDPVLHTIGKEGVQRLSSATPRDTGETARSWGYKITKKSFGTDVTWFNKAHPHTSANVALLKQFGHGTGTGGYVPPVDYINPALANLFMSAGDRIIKEMFR